MFWTWLKSIFCLSLHLVFDDLLSSIMCISDIVPAWPTSYRFPFRCYPLELILKTLPVMSFMQDVFLGLHLRFCASLCERLLWNPCITQMHFLESQGWLLLLLGNVWCGPYQLPLTMKIHFHFNACYSAVWSFSVFCSFFHFQQAYIEIERCSTIAFNAVQNSYLKKCKCRTLAGREGEHSIEYNIYCDNFSLSFSDTGRILLHLHILARGAFWCV